MQDILSNCFLYSFFVVPSLLGTHTTRLYEKKTTFFLPYVPSWLGIGSVLSNEQATGEAFSFLFIDAISSTVCFTSAIRGHPLIGLIVDTRSSRRLSREEDGRGPVLGPVP